MFSSQQLSPPQKACHWPPPKAAHPPHQLVSITLHIHLHNTWLYLKTPHLFVYLPPTPKRKIHEGRDLISLIPYSRENARRVSDHYQALNKYFQNWWTNKEIWTQTPMFFLPVVLATLSYHPKPPPNPYIHPTETLGFKQIGPSLNPKSRIFLLIWEREGERETNINEIEKYRLPPVQAPTRNQTHNLLAYQTMLQPMEPPIQGQTESFEAGFRTRVLVICRTDVQKSTMTYLSLCTPKCWHVSKSWDFTGIQFNKIYQAPLMH